MLERSVFGGIEIFNYGDYADRSNGMWQNGQSTRNNYGCHTMGIKILGGIFFFSYETLIAVYHPTIGFCMRKNDWGVNTAHHMYLIRYKYAQRLSSEERHEELSKEAFWCNVHNLQSYLGLAPDGLKLPKFLFALETDEVVDAKWGDKIEDIRTPGRTRAVRLAKQRAKEKERRKREAIKKGVATRKRRRERAIFEAQRAEREEAIRGSSFLQPDDLPSEGEEMIA
jgi:hypothetical protein